MYLIGRGQVIVKQLHALMAFSDDEKGAVSFNVGDFYVWISKEEYRVFRSNQIMSKLYNELWDTAVAVKRERNDRRLFFHPGNRWEPVLKSAAKYGQELTVGQFVLMAKIILTDTFEIRGEAGYTCIKHLFALTPGSRNEKAPPFPRPQNGQMERISLVKFFDDKTQKNTVKLVIPAGEMTARVFGKAAANIKFLGTIFAGEADVHFWVEQFAEEVDLSRIADKVLANLT